MGAPAGAAKDERLASPCTVRHPRTRLAKPYRDGALNGSHQGFALDREQVAG